MPVIGFLLTRAHLRLRLARNLLDGVLRNLLHLRSRASSGAIQISPVVDYVDLVPYDDRCLRVVLLAGV